jgi:hypothetical protein
MVVLGEINPEPEKHQRFQEYPKMILLPRMVSGLGSMWVCLKIGYPKSDSQSPFSQTCS